jgi:hypothetical protein
MMITGIEKFGSARLLNAANFAAADRASLGDQHDAASVKRAAGSAEVLWERADAVFEMTRILTAQAGRPGIDRGVALLAVRSLALRRLCT